MKEFLFYELQVKAFSIMFFMDSYKYLCNKFLLEYNARGEMPPMMFFLPPPPHFY